MTGLTKERRAEIQPKYGRVPSALVLQDQLIEVLGALDTMEAERNELRSGRLFNQASGLAAVCSQLEHELADARKLAGLWRSEAVGLGSVTGSLETGKKADVIIVDGDPLSDISSLQRVDTVFKDGQQVAKQGEVMI